MAISRGSKIVVAVGAVLGLSFFALVVELGVNAGVIHHGVSINDIDVGGKTEEEVVDELQRRVDVLSDEAILFTAEFLDFEFYPEDIGWRPRVVETAAKAMRIGRDDAPFGALADRFRAWFGGVTLYWTGSPRARMVSAMLDEWEAAAAGVGAEIDRWRTRKRIRRAIVTWPRHPFQIAVVE